MAWNLHRKYVHSVGLRRVEVNTPDQPVRMAYPGENLEAPGVLRNAVPVEALFDPAVGREVTLRHLLQRYGYESLDAVRAEGEALALREAILETLAVREIEIPDEIRQAIEASTNLEALRTWRRRALTAASAREAVESPG